MRWLSFFPNIIPLVNEVNRKNILNDNYYLKGDIIGKQGVEMSYEKYLRGIKGTEFIQKDRFNRDIGKYKDGALDIPSISGKDLTITIDSELQEYTQIQDNSDTQIMEPSIRQVNYVMQEQILKK